MTDKIEIVLITNILQGLVRMVVFLIIADIVVKTFFTIGMVNQRTICPRQRD